MYAKEMLEQTGICILRTLILSYSSLRMIFQIIQRFYIYHLNQLKNISIYSGLTQEPSDER